MSESIFILTILALIGTVYTGATQNLFLGSLSLTLWLTVLLLVVYTILLIIFKK